MWDTLYNVVNARQCFIYTANNKITKLQTKVNGTGSVAVELSAQDFIIAGSSPGMVDSFLPLKSESAAVRRIIWQGEGHVRRRLWWSAAGVPQFALHVQGHWRHVLWKGLRNCGSSSSLCEGLQLYRLDWRNRFQIWITFWLGFIVAKIKILFHLLCRLSVLH